uniref:40S ribosomal protein S15 n=1 Tax=Pongo abelii TaxID=9601 RepID=A0A8I5U2G1_PONAB
MAEVEQKKKRTFRKFTYRGVDLDQLLDMSYEQLMPLYSACQRWRLNRGLRRKQHSLLKRLRKSKKEAPPMEKPEVVKAHLRDMIILPEMVGSMVGVYNGKTFNQHFREHLDKLFAKGIGMLDIALNEAFNILSDFNHTGQGSICSQAIMLITDGAVDTYDTIFAKYNWPDRKVCCLHRRC